MRSLLSILLFFPILSHAAVIYDTLHINNGYHNTFDGENIEFLSFNSSSTFEVKNSRVEIGIGDSLYLTIYNNDSITHGIDITNTTGYSTTVAAGGTVTIPTLFTSQEVHVIYDPLNYPNSTYLGLGTMLIVDDFSLTGKFYWNIKEFRDDWNDSIVNSNSVPWNLYYPNYFILNGASNPDINDDPDARVTGSVGDTLRIYMANTGQSVHSFHFHGYHCKIVNYSKKPSHVGRDKDTFPMYSLDTYILELIPQQEGEYPVHDHNLVALTGGNVFPMGIMLTILIE